MKRLMLVDDHPIVRTGIRQIFRDCPDIVVDCETADGTEALALLKGRSIDAVLLDLSMPGRSGMALLRRMRAEHPALPILIVSMHDEAQYAVNVMKAGANGFLSKHNAPDEIMHATRTVLDGKTYLSEAFASELATSYASGAEARALHQNLSPREFEVFYQIACGKSTSVIASELFLSVKTVSTHRARILEKMGYKSTADLVYYAITHALIE